MGQQQLLLLTLSLVIVGIATLSGISAYSENSQRNERANQRQMMLEIVQRAKAWKMTPERLGGSPDATKDDVFDYSEVSFFDLGMEASGKQNGKELLYVTSVGCFKLQPNANRLQISLLEPPACDNGSWEMRLQVSANTTEEASGIKWLYRTDETPR